MTDEDIVDAKFNDAILAAFMPVGPAPVTKEEWGLGISALMRQVRSDRSDRDCVRIAAYCIDKVYVLVLGNPEVLTAVKRVVHAADNWVDFPTDENRQRVRRAGKELRGGYSSPAACVVRAAEFLTDAIDPDPAKWGVPDGVGDAISAALHVVAALSISDPLNVDENLVKNSAVVEGFIHEWLSVFPARPRPAMD